MVDDKLKIAINALEKIVGFGFCIGEGCTPDEPMCVGNIAKGALKRINEVSPEEREQAKNLISQYEGGLIPAIVFIRKITGWDLKQARDYAKQIRMEMERDCLQDEWFGEGK